MHVWKYNILRDEGSGIGRVNMVREHGMVKNAPFSGSSVIFVLFWMRSFLGLIPEASSEPHCRTCHRLVKPHYTGEFGFCSVLQKHFLDKAAYSGISPYRAAASWSLFIVLYFLNSFSCSSLSEEKQKLSYIRSQCNDSFLLGKKYQRRCF